ncbi:hypothetical protein J5X98_07740 [Leptothermofonsia sichuanensis E412]|uniref:hypothetical protein n=1 Tax=Leptothermofonsia sichuanensis TaxID=2917832 RepID=UPI001CA76A06|nr:hypothetical protein [Leptothermofonsia sichuanensis]QZZ22270.1 hypothetical protein J5X98_07740 [Leptothermofonsia sichuanensis E412]
MKSLETYQLQLKAYPKSPNRQSPDPARKVFRAGFYRAVQDERCDRRATGWVSWGSGFLWKTVESQ